MTLGTPNDAYDVDRASHLLSSVGDAPVKVAVHDLQARGVISLLARDPTKPKPGRTLKISDVYVIAISGLVIYETQGHCSNQNALSGNIAAELFQDASALEELVSQQDEDMPWREWPLLATDGDLAALVELVSDGKVQLSVTFSRPSH